MNNGYIRVAAASPRVNVADVEFNVGEILKIAERLEEAGVEIAVFPEMCITGYTCGDLFHSDLLLEAASRGVERIKEWARGRKIRLIVGFPRIIDGQLYNCAAVLPDGPKEVRKTYIPNYNEFYERRWWRPAPEEEPGMVFECAGIKFGIEICEDLWAPVAPSSHLALAGAEVIFNLSASDDIAGKYSYLRSIVTHQSAACLCGYVYAGAGFGESSTDLVFDGKAMVAENGIMIAEKARWDVDSEPFVIADIDIAALRHDRLHDTTFGDCAAREPRKYETLQCSADGDLADDTTFIPRFRPVNPWPFVPPEGNEGFERCEEILSIQAAGLARRLDFIKCRNAVVGISGGLDSTLALLVTVRTFDRLGLDRKGITGITMPGFGTTGRTRSNAVRLMEELGVSIAEIPIAEAVNLHFRDIGQDPELRDVTYENSQARERTQILMDYANRKGAIVIGTGDLSELALGWATYNGDHMSMYAVNAGVPKTLVGRLVRHEAGLERMATVRDTLLDILDTPVSPELIPALENGDIAQRTEDIVGPYELHDFFLYHTIRFGALPRRIHMLACMAFDGRYDRATVLKWLRTFYRRFFSQQFKRSCMPDGPKVGSICLSPRGDWRMPSDACGALWQHDLAALEEK